MCRSENFKKRFYFAVLAAATAVSVVAAAGSPAPLKVAAVQMRSSTNLAENVAAIVKSIRHCSSNGVRVVVFPECALSGYFENVITNLSPAQISQAEEQIAAACRDGNAYAIVGSPRRDGAALYNSATVFSPAGAVLTRYDKIQLAEGWPDPGQHLTIFKIDGIACSIIICHDERYPELVRLPVLAGAQVIFYISHESGLAESHKIAPYRAQIQARAVENTVFVVHSNAPANADNSGSHGHSRIVAPDGNIIVESGISEEGVVTAELDLRKATRANAKNSLLRGPLREWWKQGIQQVRIPERETPTSRTPSPSTLPSATQ